jgi:hypothetical protein
MKRLLATVVFLLVTFVQGPSDTLRVQLPSVQSKEVRDYYDDLVVQQVPTLRPGETLVDRIQERMRESEKWQGFHWTVTKPPPLLEEK